MKEPENKSKYVGKHIGACSKKECGFTLLGSLDTKCPRCEKRIEKEVAQ